MRSILTGHYQRGEEEGRAPNAIVRRLAALAPSGMQKGVAPKAAARRG